MKETITKITCDLCHKTMNASSTPIHIPVIFHTDQTEGRGCKPYLSAQDLDLCPECIMKSTNVHGRGAQGFNEYSLECKEAREKQTAQKPFQPFGTHSYKCPKCWQFIAHEVADNCDLQREMAEWCPYCGQKLCWNFEQGAFGNADLADEAR